MDQPLSLSALEDFAMDCLYAANHLEDQHVFRLFTCRECGFAEFKLDIEHHTGSKDWSFKGIIRGECTKCGYLNTLFTFTGEHRKYLREERPVCDCGHRLFICGMCERFEGDQGFTGFFDEGVIVGQCSDCRLDRLFVRTD